MVYDFNKDLIVDSKNKKNTSKIETLLKDYKKQFTINNGKEEVYPLISIFKRKKEGVKDILKENKDNKDNEENEENKEKKDNIQMENNISNNDKLLINKINEAINNHKDEIPIKKLKILTIISFIFLICIGLLNFIYNLYFSSSIQELYMLIRYSLDIKSNNLISIYYIRELTLFNITVEGIKGGEYTKFPDNYKNHYITLIKEKLVDLFKETQFSMKKIFSTILNMSKNTSNYFSNTKLNIEILNTNYAFNYISSNLNTILMQYINSFYNIVFGDSLIIKDQYEIFDFIHNSFNNYGKAQNILINIYNFELESLSQKLKKILFITLSILFLLFVIIYILGIVYFISSNIRRMSYIEVFYSINTEILRIEMLSCLKLVNKFKISKNEGKNYNDEEDQENSLEAQIKFINNNLKNNNINNNLDSSEENNININRSVLSYFNKLFIIFFGLFILFVFGYFVFMCIYLFGILKRYINISKFSNQTLIFQFNLLEMFNAYREYLFDDHTLISNMSSYDYLIKKEKEIYESITQNIQNVNDTLILYIKSNPEIQKIFNSNYCSHCITEYFNSTNECNNKFGNILNLDFYNFMDHFLDQLRLKKNVAKYLIENGYYYGNLLKYDNENLTNIFLENNNSDSLYRLDLFNDENLHSDLNLLFFNIILPFLDSLFRLIMSSKQMEGGNFYFVLIILLYILVLIIIFFACIFPLINFLNKQIYKTKNILSIIPINFLLYNSNIKSFINLMINE